MLTETSALSEELFDFQEVLLPLTSLANLSSPKLQTLFTTNESIELPPRKKRKVDQDRSESLDDLEADVNQATVELSSLEHA
jgi:capsule polysaccharide export protein KpsE/RkpR